MASTSTQLISPSHSLNLSYKVFLSFRGDDTRYNFTGYLYEELTRNGIHTFRDDEELEQGGVIASRLSIAIEESKCFVVIFSENYANSRWCLNELLEIIECMNTKGRLVLPVFYHVDPSDVRNQRGSYGRAFATHEIDANEEKKERIQKWRTALKEAANLNGYHLQKNEYESKLVQKIVDDILKRLTLKLVHIDENIVGKDFYLEKLKPLLNLHLINDVRMIGIYGIGGIGKTTIAKILYNDILYEFESGSFLEGVRGRFGTEYNQRKLQEQLLRDILMRKDINLSSTNEGVNMIKDRFSSKKVLVVLDDVNHLDQLKRFIECREWFGPGSRILITTRNKHLLDVHAVDALYNVDVLPPKEAMLLFSRQAFKQAVPIKDYEELSDYVVRYVQSLPLALKVLGSFLYGMTMDEWDSALDQLKRTSNMEIHNVLSISFNGLDNDRYKEVFLDIACFFIGNDKDFVLRILQHGKFQPHAEIKVLCDRCLIMISNNKIHMHDLIRQMGWDIVQEKFPKEPWKWSRLWDSNDIRDAFSKEEGMKKIEVLCMDLSHIKKINFNTKVFSEMKSLRLLKVHWSNHNDFMEMKKRKLLSKDFEFPSYQLRYLYWDGFSLKSLPSNFDGENIVELHLRHSSIKRLWKGNKCLDKLTVLDLSYSEKLIKMPKLSNMPNLKTLVLEGCVNLRKFRPSMGDSNKLTFLNLKGCKSLTKFPSSTELESLEYFDLSDCTNIENFPEIGGNVGRLRKLLLNKTSIKEFPIRMEYLQCLEVLDLSYCAHLKKFPDITEGNMRHLRKLCLKGTAIRELPSSIGYLESLELLNLENCAYFEKFPDIIEGNLRNLTDLCLGRTPIRELPSSIKPLTSLQLLELSECTIFKKFPDIIEGNLRKLRDLCLERTAIRELPSSIGHLEYLVALRLSFSNLYNFPEIERNMKWIRELDLSCNANIVELPSSIDRLVGLKYLYLNECKNLRRIPNSICKLKSLHRLYLTGCLKLKAFPEIREDMKHLELLCLSRTPVEKLPSSSIQHLKHVRRLRLNGCINLAAPPETVGLPLASLSHLCFHKELDVSGCHLMEEQIPSNIRCLYSLKALDLSRNHIWRLPAGIAQLSKLKSLKLSHCKMLEEISMLPSSLRSLEAHDCPCLRALCSPTSLFPYPIYNCFESITQEYEWKKSDGNPIKSYCNIIIPGSSGIAKWTGTQQNRGNEVRIELPVNWYKDNKLLGFAFFFLFDPCCELSYQSLRLKCKFTFLGNGFEFQLNLQFDSWCPCGIFISSGNGSLDPGLWLTYYPKTAIKGNNINNHPSGWTTLRAFFDSDHIYCRKKDEPRAKPKKCGIYPSSI